MKMVGREGRKLGCLALNFALWMIKRAYVYDRSYYALPGVDLWGLHRKQRKFCLSTLHKNLVVLFFKAPMGLIYGSFLGNLEF